MSVNSSKILQEKVIFIGDSGVGKTSIVSRRSGGSIDQEGSPTICSEQTIIKEEYDNRKLDLIVWDTAGQERYKSLSVIFIRFSKAVIIVFSANDRSTFNSVDDWYDKAQSVLYNENPYYILVENKCDLYDENDKNSVSFEEGKNKADSLGIDFLYTSAFDGININELFQNIAANYISSLKTQKSSIETHDLDLEKDTLQNETKSSCC
ncbi:hypothetical protein M9Y10_028227 [Tritrichomonas musculus]|uniref:Uncharacterized protein n=1 Tax=Tritrichomonas musculus TaxID=1915356 RepID=A0ABR2KIQ7_9EUKA